MFKFVVRLSHSLILVTESSNMAPHGKELSEDLKRCIDATFILLLLCQSVILSVLSHEEIYLNICRNVRGCTHFCDTL